MTVCAEYSDAGFTFVETDSQMITANGAASLKEMFDGNLDPDERIWSKSAMGHYVIITGAVRLVWFEHKLTLNRMEIVGIDIDRHFRNVIYPRQGLEYDEVGSLVFTTADRCTVRVPIVSDIPIRYKEWLV